MNALLVIFGPALLYLAITLPVISLAGLLRGWTTWRRRGQPNFSRTLFASTGCASPRSISSSPPKANAFLSPLSMQRPKPRAAGPLASAAHEACDARARPAVHRVQNRPA